MHSLGVKSRPPPGGHPPPGAQPPPGARTQTLPVARPAATAVQAAKTPTQGVKSPAFAAALASGRGRGAQIVPVAAALAAGRGRGRGAGPAAGALQPQGSAQGNALATALTAISGRRTPTPPGSRRVSLVSVPGGRGATTPKSAPTGHFKQTTPTAGQLQQPPGRGTPLQLQLRRPVGAPPPGSAQTKTPAVLPVKSTQLASKVPPPAPVQPKAAAPMAPLSAKLPPAASEAADGGAGIAAAAAAAAHTADDTTPPPPRCTPPKHPLPAEECVGGGAAPEPEPAPQPSEPREPSVQSGSAPEPAPAPQPSEPREPSVQSGAAPEPAPQPGAAPAPATALQPGAAPEPAPQPSEQREYSAPRHHSEPREPSVQPSEQREYSAPIHHSEPREPSVQPSVPREPSQPASAQREGSAPAHHSEPRDAASAIRERSAPTHRSEPRERSQTSSVHRDSVLPDQRSEAHDAAGSAAATQHSRGASPAQPEVRSPSAQNSLISNELWSRMLDALGSVRGLVSLLGVPEDRRSASADTLKTALRAVSMPEWVESVQHLDRCRNGEVDLTVLLSKAAAEADVADADGRAVSTTPRRQLLTPAPLLDDSSAEPASPAAAARQHHEPDPVKPRRLRSAQRSRPTDVDVVHNTPPPTAQPESGPALWNDFVQRLQHQSLPVPGPTTTADEFALLTESKLGYSQIEALCLRTQWLRFMPASPRVHAGAPQSAARKSIDAPAAVTSQVRDVVLASCTCPPGVALEVTRVRELAPSVHSIDRYEAARKRFPTSLQHKKVLYYAGPKLPSTNAVLHDGLERELQRNECLPFSTLAHVAPTPGKVTTKKLLLCEVLLGNVERVSQQSLGIIATRPDVHQLASVLRAAKARATPRSVSTVAVDHTYCVSAAGDEQVATQYVVSDSACVLPRFSVCLRVSAAPGPSVLDDAYSSGGVSPLRTYEMRAPRIRSMPSPVRSGFGDEVVDRAATRLLRQKLDRLRRHAGDRAKDVDLALVRLRAAAAAAAAGGLRRQRLAAAQMPYLDAIGRQVLSDEAAAELGAASEAAAWDSRLRMEQDGIQSVIAELASANEAADRSPRRAAAQAEVAEARVASIQRHLERLQDALVFKLQLKYATTAQATMG